MNIDKILHPEEGRLNTTKETHTAYISDAELDRIDCTFNYDGCVQINTKDLTYITLTVDNLERLIYLIGKSEHIYDKGRK